MEEADSKDQKQYYGRAESKHLSLEVPLPIESFEFTDDIDCRSWLTEINLVQYTETFLINLSMDNKHIRRKRLNQLRQQDLSAMNITNFSHQKRLMDHIRLVLKFPFHSPHRKKEIKDLYVEPEPVVIDLFDAKSVDASENKTQSTGNTKNTTKPQVKAQSTALAKKKQARRRRSFDADVWNSISNMRKKSVNSAAVAEQLRAGMFANTDTKPAVGGGDRRSSIASLDGSSVGSKDRTKRWSFHGNDAESHTALVHASIERARAMMYGNMALEYDIMLTNLHTLQTEVLNQFKETINCEVASLFFVNHNTRELLLCSSEARWYRVPFGVGICGYCMETGENVNIPDAYQDYRFNKNMDIKTGFRTRSILCQPVRGMRGGGAIIGVIQMLNKKGGDGTFDANDEEMLSTFTEKVADMLSARFSNLIDIADKFSGHAMFVGAKGGNVGDRPNNYQTHTASSSKHACADFKAESADEAK